MNLCKTFMIVTLILISISISFGNEDLAKKAVVIISFGKSGGEYGSGAFISEYYVLTAYHVVDNGYNIIVYNKYYNYKSKAYIIAYDNIFDIAILKVEKQPPNELIIPICEDKPILGEKFIIIGYPAEQLIKKKGNVYKMDAVGLEGEVADIYDKFFESSIEVNPGGSGGPVISKSGECIIGIVSFAYKSNKLVHPAFFMVSNEPIIELLNKKGIKYKKVPLSKRIERKIIPKSSNPDIVKYLLIASFFITIIVIISFKIVRVVR